MPPFTVASLLRALGRSKRDTVAGILDGTMDGTVLRTSGYLPGANDVAVGFEVAQRFGLRPGDAVQGTGRPLSNVDSVNGLTPVIARPDFHRLPTTDPFKPLQLKGLPLLRGQRILLEVPTTADLADLTQTGTHDAHVMLVVVDAPNEVLKSLRPGQVELITTGADRSQAEHRGVVALVIERAKRLVELGHDVVVLFDSVSRFGRFDPDAAHLARQLLGTARSIKDGGSMTVVGGYDTEIPPVLSDLVS